MLKFIRDLIEYLKEFFSEGQQILLIAFDVLGIILLFFPQIFEGRIPNESGIRVVGGIIFSLSFVWANFRIFRKFHRSTEVELDVKGLESVGLRSGGIDFDNNRVSINPEFVVYLSIRISLNNPGPPTSVRIFLEPDYLDTSNSTVSDIEMRLEHHPISQRQTPLENPCYLQTSERKDNIILIAEVPFRVAGIVKAFGSLSAFRQMRITVGAEQSGFKPISQSVQCDLTDIQEKIEEKLASQINHLQNRRVSGQQVLHVLKEYWIGPTAT